MNFISETITDWKIGVLGIPYGVGEGAFIHIG